MRGRVVLSVSVLLCAACSTAPGVDSETLDPCPPSTVETAGWEAIRTGAFSFRLPPGFQSVDVQGTDSQVGMYRSGDGSAQISFDLGWYSNDLANQAGTYEVYASCTETIGGRSATVVTGTLSQPSETGGRHVVAAAWRNIHESDPPVHLTIWNTAGNEARVDTLLAVIRTVQFTGEGSAP